MKKKREREKETSRNRSERILHAVQVQRSPTAPQGSSPQREREKKKRVKRFFRSISTKRELRISSTRENMWPAAIRLTVRFSLVFQMLSLSSIRVATILSILTSRRGTMEIANKIKFPSFAWLVYYKISPFFPTIIYFIFHQSLMHHLYIYILIAFINPLLQNIHLEILYYLDTHVQ